MILCSTINPPFPPLHTLKLSLEVRSTVSRPTSLCAEIDDGSDLTFAARFELRMASFCLEFRVLRYSFEVRRDRHLALCFHGLGKHTRRQRLCQTPCRSHPSLLAPGPYGICLSAASCLYDFIFMSSYLLLANPSSARCIPLSQGEYDC